LLGVRGDLRRINASVHQLVETWPLDGTLCAPPGEHSAKPPEVRERIVKLMGDLPRIELFARERTEGWDVFGNDPALGESDLTL
jgi:N6-adenosine-specific RNA methylase IME4